MAQLHVEEVHGVDGLAQLAAIWGTLADEAHHGSFFVSHAWFTALVAGLDADRNALFLVIRDGTTVVGIVPLLLQPTRWRVFPARLALLMQNQDSPYSDLLALPSHCDAVVRATFAHLQRRGGWHLWSATKVERSSPTWSSLATALGDHASLRAPSGTSPVLDLTGDWNEFWTAQSQRFKKTVRNVANRIERLGAVEIRDEATRDNPAHCSAVFRSVASRSWKATLPISVTSSPAIERFFTALTATLCAQNRLRMWVLRLDGEPIATEYHVQDERNVYALRSDFDDAHRAASPGAYLHAAIVRSYFASDVAVYDMGPGDRDYKQRWATTMTERDAFWLFNRVPYATALYTLERRAIPQLRRARAWWHGLQHDERQSVHLA